MDRYIKGLLTAYDRVLNLMDAIDPTHSELGLECLRIRINASLAAYHLYLSKEDLEEYESEKLNQIKALTGYLSEEDIDKSIEETDTPQGNCKILKVSNDYFMHKSDS